MAFALAKENLTFIQRMLRLGRYNNQSEVVREALRRMESDELSYLAPPLLTPGQIEAIYGKNTREDEAEKAFGQAAFSAIRRAAKKRK